MEKRTAREKLLRVLLVAAFLPPSLFLPAAARAAEEAPAGTVILDSDTDFEVETGQIPRRPGEGNPPPVMVIESRPSGAAVHINFAYAGSTPLTVRNLKPGGYRVTLTKENYSPASIFLTLDSGRTFRLFGRLREAVGTLKVIAAPPDAEIFAGGTRIWDSQALLPVGRYEVRVRRFGYKDFAADARVEENRTTVVEAALEPAPFEVEGFSASRRRLNPDNPGLTGRTDLNFNVTSYGAGRLTIYGPRGEEVRRHSFAPFATWRQSFRWDGLGDLAEPLPDGAYRAVLEVRSRDGKIVSRLETLVLLDRSLVIRYRSLYYGQTGLMYAPAASVLPAGSFQISSAILGLAAVSGESSPESLYFAHVGAAIGVTPRIELTPLLSIAATNDESPPDINASAALKYAAYRGGNGSPFSFSPTLRVDLSTEPSYSGRSQFPGVTAGAALELRFGPFGLLASPEFQLSPYRLGDDVETSADPSPRASAMMRFGLFFESGAVMAGFSTVMAAGLFPEAAALHYPTHTGFEIHGLLPDSLLYVSAYMSWEYRPAGPDRIFLGGGLGILY